MTESFNQSSSHFIWGVDDTSSRRGAPRDLPRHRASTPGAGPQNLLQAALPSSGFGKTLSSLELTALHEAGHAVSWHLGGGTIESIALRPAPDGWDGLCTYVLDEPLGRHGRHLLARAAMAATLLCDVAGFPDCSDAWTGDYAAAIAALQPLYRTERGLAGAAAMCWRDAVEIVSCPVGFRSAAALTRRLVQERSLYEFPDECHVRDFAPVPGLATAAERLRNDFERAKMEDIAWAISWAAGRNAP